jgi:hypothetical protein
MGIESVSSIRTGTNLPDAVLKNSYFSDSAAVVMGAIGTIKSNTAARRKKPVKEKLNNI